MIDRTNPHTVIMHFYTTLIYIFLVGSAAAERHMKGLSAPEDTTTTTTEVPLDSNSTTTTTNSTESAEDVETTTEAIPPIAADCVREDSVAVRIIIELRLVILASIALAGLPCILCACIKLAKLHTKNSSANNSVEMGAINEAAQQDAAAAAAAEKDGKDDQPVTQD